MSVVMAAKLVGAWGTTGTMVVAFTVADPQPDPVVFTARNFML